MDKHNLDKLSADILDNDFVKIFRPIHFSQLLLGGLQVNIKYGFVTATTCGYNAFSIFIWFTHIFSVTAFVVDCKSSAETVSDFYLKLGHILNGLFSLIITIKSFCKRNLLSEFYVKLQKIDRDLYMKYVKKRNKDTSILSAIIVILTIIVTIIWSAILNLYVIKELCPAAFFVQVPVLGTYMEMILVFFKLYFIVIRLEYINSELQGTLHKSACSVVVLGPVYVFDEINEIEDKLWNRLIMSLDDIMNVLESFTHIYQFTIFCLTFEFMLLNMIFVQSIVTSIKEQTPINIYSFTSLVPVITFLFFILMMCTVAEMLKSKMDNTKKFCTRILFLTNGSTRDNIKRLITVLEVKSSISIYDVYELDIQLPFNLFAITATYTIVLLQFALL